MILLDLDFTQLAVYGRQEGKGFNFHYQSHGYHPPICYDGMAGNFLKIELYIGMDYSYIGVTDFLQSLLNEIPLLLRCDNGFVSPELYKQCKVNGTFCVIHLKTDRLVHMFTFIVTNMDSSPEDLIRF